MNFHGSFHRTTGPVLCRVPLQLREGFWGSGCRIGSPWPWEIPMFLQEEIVLCCRTAGTAEVAAVQMWAYLWVERGEERKDKMLKLVIWSFILWFAEYTCCRPGRGNSEAQQKKIWEFYSSAVTELSKHICIISKIHSTADYVQKNTGVQNVYGLEHWWAVRGRPAWFRREVSAQMWIRQGRNLYLHFLLPKSALCPAQNPSQKRSTGNHKRFWKIFQFCISWQKMGTTSMQGTANTIA